MVIKYSPLVSIIVAVYNSEKTLDACLRSIIDQTYPNRELIIIDGSSTDSSIEIIKNHQDSITYWVSEPDQGIYDAWNKGFRLASGEWIAFVGSDDEFFSKSVLADMVNFLSDKPGVEYLSGIADYYYPDGALRKTLGSDWNWNIFKRSVGKVVHPGSLHRRSLFTRYGEFDCNYEIAGDYDFLLRGGPELKADFFPSVIMKVGAGGASSKYAIKTLKEVLIIQVRNSYIHEVEAYFNYVLLLSKYIAGRIKYGLIRFTRNLTD